MRYYLLLLPTILFVLYGCVSPETKTNAVTQEQLSITTYHPTKEIISGGQPSENDLQVLANNGTKHIVNLRPANEPVSFNEKTAVESLGMSYHFLPVNGAKGITQDNAQQLNSLLASINNEPAFIHCASGNRVGALIAMRAHFIQNMSIEESIKEGKRWGLTSLEQTVRQKIEQ